MCHLIAFYVILNYLYRLANQIIIFNDWLGAGLCFARCGTCLSSPVLFVLTNACIIHYFPAWETNLSSGAGHQSVQSILAVQKEIQLCTYKRIHLSLLATKRVWVCECECECFVRSGCCYASFNTRCINMHACVRVLNPSYQGMHGP